MKKKNFFINFYMFILIFLFCPLNVFGIEINSKNYIMIDMDSNRVIFEKNSLDEISVASLTKIVTAITFIDLVDDLSTSTTITSNDLDKLNSSQATSAGFKLNQNVTLLDLLNGLMLPSGADAAYALERYLLEVLNIDLVVAMNDLVSSLGLENSNFLNSTGLDQDGQYSSVYDISQILNYALLNEDFFKIFSSSSYLTSDTSMTFKSSLTYYNQIDGFLNTYIKGSKTGYTSLAGMCLASMSVFDEKNFLIVSAGSSRESYLNHINDHNNIYSYVDENFLFFSLFDSSTILSYIPTKFSNVLQYNVTSNNDFIVYTDQLDDYSYSFKGLLVVDPSMENQKIGVVNVFFKNFLIDSIDIYYDQSLEYSFFGFVDVNQKKILIICISFITGFLLLIGSLKLKSH